MAVIFSLQGCMAVGKTTAAKYVEENMPSVFVSYENPAPMLSEVKQRGLQQNTFEGFTEIQRIFIRAEIQRWEQNKKKDYVLLDLGPEEIEFFTLFYPKSMGFDWNMELHLETELNALRQCMADHVLFLDSNVNTLIEHKENDITRRRGAFEHYLTNMLPLKKDWFLSKRDIKPDILVVDNMDKIQLGEAVASWMNKHIALDCPA